MRKFLISIKLGCAAVVVATAAFIALKVSAEPQTAYEQGVLQYQRENYDEALSRLTAAREESPNTRVSYYLGLTYKKLQDYIQAKFYLTEAVEGEPKIEGALPELIEVCCQTDDTASAKKLIAAAETQGMRPGQTAFIKGLVLAKEDKTQEAIAAFKDAKSLEPTLKQSADYQIGLAHLKAKSWNEAAESFQEVVLLDPNTDIARYADEYKKALDQRRAADKPYRLNAGLFVEYDDNVILKPSDASSVGDVGNEADWREVATVNAELGGKWNERFGAKLLYDLYFAKQNDLHAFDVNSHTLGAVPSWYVGSHVVSVPVQYNYTWVDGDQFLSTVTVNPLANLKLAGNLLGQVGVKLQAKDYKRPPSNPNEDRDAVRWAPGAGWFYFFNKAKSFLNARYEYDAENADGGNWDYDGHRVSLAVQVPVPNIEKLKLTVAGDLYRQDFDKTHTSFAVRREDEAVTGSLLLTWALNPVWDAQVRYTYVNHNSNISIYEYQRNIISTGMTAKF